MKPLPTVTNHPKVSLETSLVFRYCSLLTIVRVDPTPNIYCKYQTIDISRTKDKECLVELTIWSARTFGKHLLQSKLRTVPSNACVVFDEQTSSFIHSYG